MNTPWRVGRKVGRTIYDASDQLIGVMDSPELARCVVEAVNEVTLRARLAGRPLPASAKQIRYLGSTLDIPVDGPVAHAQRQIFLRYWRKRSHE